MEGKSGRAPRGRASWSTSEKAVGGGDREAMETWFERAMKADGNDQGACWSKLDWLDPKWYGGNSPEEMMAFGKACAATKNWHTGITLLAADAHLRYSGMLEQAAETPYMKSPDVWSEIQMVYDEYLKHYPKDNVAAEQVRDALLPGRPLRRGAHPISVRGRRSLHVAGLSQRPLGDVEGSPRILGASRRGQAARGQHPRPQERRPPQTFEVKWGRTQGLPGSRDPQLDGRERLGPRAGQVDVADADGGAALVVVKTELPGVVRLEQAVEDHDAVERDRYTTRR